MLQDNGKFGHRSSLVRFLNVLLEMWHCKKPKQFEPRHEISNTEFDILTSVDFDEPLHPPFKLRNSKWCSVSSLPIIEYSSD